MEKIVRYYEELNLFVDNFLFDMIIENRNKRFFICGEFGWIIDDIFFFDMIICLKRWYEIFEMEKEFGLCFFIVFGDYFKDDLNVVEM